MVVGAMCYRCYDCFVPFATALELLLLRSFTIDVFVAAFSFSLSYVVSLPPQCGATRRELFCRRCFNSSVLN
ncbi:hypothetical protein BVRB_9g208110 [Beta vulgaris subsp. vulgaris]|nr:hypothetical protein BVRB_9g208110 [Beta vulgaris subsp. vulgaris]